MICGTSHLETAVPPNSYSAGFYLFIYLFEEQFGTRGCTLHSHRKKKNPCKHNPHPLPTFCPTRNVRPY